MGCQCTKSSVNAESNVDTFLPPKEPEPPKTDIRSNLPENVSIE